jgi:hypothetical protein
MLAEAMNTGLGDLAGLGSAGMMGAMWLWERRASRQREQQLDEAHQRIQADRVQLEQVITAVRQNTQALTRLCTMLEHGERGRS